MRAIWKGSISFGLVSIPISLFAASRSEEMKFRLLRAKDLSPVNYKRVAEVDGKEVPWDQIVKGYEYEKGKYVVLKDEDFKRVDVEATQTVNIVSFVKLEEVNPIFFHKPYFMEAQKTGEKAYVLLRDALVASKMIAIAQVVIKTRQHLAAVKPHEKGLMLELMHYAAELADMNEFHFPTAHKVSPAEMKMAKQLIESMTVPWDAEEYHDKYRERLEKAIDEKIRHGGKEIPATTKSRRATNVVDLAAVLQKSLDEAGGRKKRAPAKKPVAARARKSSRSTHKAPARKTAQRKTAKTSHRRSA